MALPVYHSASIVAGQGIEQGSTGEFQTFTIRHVVYDTNWWKSFVNSRLRVSMGDRGCLSLFGTNAKTHRMLSEHLTCEYFIKTDARGRRL